jgi:hypothetical protein
MLFQAKEKNARTNVIHAATNISTADAVDHEKTQDDFKAYHLYIYIYSIDGRMLGSGGRERAFARLGERELVVAAHPSVGHVPFRTEVRYGVCPSFAVKRLADLEFRSGSHFSTEAFRSLHRALTAPLYTSLPSAVVSQPKSVMVNKGKRP